MSVKTSPVVIAGAGITGSVLALALAQAGQSVCLVESRPPNSNPKDPRGQRPIALSLASERIFRGLGVWPAIAPHAAAIRMVHVSERGHFGVTRIRSEDCAVPALGQVCEARHIEAALADALQSHTRPGAKVWRMQPVMVSHTDPGEEQVRVHLAGTGDVSNLVVPNQIEARLVVAADGADSGLRDTYKLPVIEYEYQQLALVCKVQVRTPHQGRAFERFTPYGPLAMLPLVDGRCGVIWSLERALGEEFANLNDQDYCKLLQEHFGNRLGVISDLKSRNSFPLKLVQSQALTGPRFAMVGNAAQQLHPIAGQGLNLGLRDVALLAELVAGQLSGNQDPGCEIILNEYAEGRQSDRHWVTRFTDLLARSLTPRYARLSGLRSLGLLSLDLLPFIKGALAKRTMGLAGYQPRLVRGLPLERSMPEYSETVQ